MLFYDTMSYAQKEVLKKQFENEFLNSKEPQKLTVLHGILFNSYQNKQMKADRWNDWGK